MAACGSLQQLFEKPLPENPSLLESLSSPWKQIKTIKTIEPSFTELFGELHFKEHREPIYSFSSFQLSPSPASVFSSSFLSNPQQKLDEGSTKENIWKSTDQSYSTNTNNVYGTRHKSSDSFSCMNQESLHLCTEGLGFESLDDVEDLKNEINSNNINSFRNLNHQEEGMTQKLFSPHSPASAAAGVYICSEQYRNAKTSGTSFPPPISCIGRTGKPWVCFKSYRQDGRFVLQEVRIPTQEFLHACREDGRLRLSLVSSDNDYTEDDDDDEEEEEEQDDRKLKGEDDYVEDEKEKEE